MRDIRRQRRNRRGDPHVVAVGLVGLGFVLRLLGGKRQAQGAEQESDNETGHELMVTATPAVSVILSFTS